MVVYRMARPNERDECIDLANYAFRLDFENLMPKVYGKNVDSQAMHMVAVDEQERLRAQVAILPETVTLGDDSLQIGYLGTVSVHPRARGEGHMKVLMNMWLDSAVIFKLICVHNLKKFDNTGEDLEDLISIGTIGLIKAIESFSPNKGTKLATFAAGCIENEILMHLRSLKKTRKDVSLHDPIGTDKEGNEITLIDILGSEADDVVDAVQLKIEKSKIYRNLEILDDREKEVVVGRFGLELGGEERTQWEIAKELGISRSYVSRIEKRALMKLYHEFYKAKR